MYGIRIIIIILHEMPERKFAANLIKTIFIAFSYIYNKKMYCLNKCADKETVYLSVLVCRNIFKEGTVLNSISVTI